MAKYNAKRAAKLKREYDALKQRKSRAETSEAKREIQAEINDVISDLRDAGANTRGTKLRPQGGEGPRRGPLWPT